MREKQLEKTRRVHQAVGEKYLLKTRQHVAILIQRNIYMVSDFIWFLLYFTSELVDISSLEK